MKKLIFAFLAFTAFSCSSEDNASLDNCEGNKTEINAYFDTQIEWVVENSSPVDTRKIQLLNQERDDALQNACDQ